MEQAFASPDQPDPASLAAAPIDLQGTLPCARCAYDLKGLSITSVCPECSVPVRATILTRIDPQADELQSLFFPWTTAWGMVVWTTAALAATIASWLLKAEDFGAPLRLPAWTPHAIPILAALSALGAIVMVYPHHLRSHRAVMPRPGIAGTLWGSLAAMVGIAWHIALVIALFRIHTLSLSPEQASLWRLLSLTCVMGALICLRPNARLIASRSFLMRTGQIDRQQMASLVAVVLVQAMGESLRLLTLRRVGSHHEVMTLLAEILVMAGATLFTLGLLSLCIDTIRLHRVLREPPLSLRSLLR